MSRVLAGLAALVLAVVLSVAVVTASSPQPTGTVLNGQPCSVTFSSGAQSGTCYGALVTAAPTATPTPAPTATPTPPATPTPTPVPSGWPNASNTGVPAGTHLTPSGSITVTTPGAVIQNLLITNGHILVEASNVTVKNVRIDGSDAFAAISSPPYYKATGVTVQDTEVDGRNLDPGGSETYGIWGNIATIARVNIHGVSEGIAAGQSITDSWVHDLYVTSFTHNEDVYNGGTAGGSIYVHHNTFSNQANQTATFFMTGDFSPVTNVTIDDNLLNGGGFTLYGGHETSKPYGTQDANIHVTNNHFLRSPAGYWPRGGYWGPVTAFDVTRPGNVWSGNVWDDNGATIQANGCQPSSC